MEVAGKSGATTWSSVTRRVGAVVLGGHQTVGAGSSFNFSTLDARGKPIRWVPGLGRARASRFGSSTTTKGEKAPRDDIGGMRVTSEAMP